MRRGIDHLVLAVKDLDSACTFYERLGFRLTPPAQHPFGTGNRLAQLGNDFLEIVSVTNPQDLIEHKEGAFSFGAYNRDYLSAREGMSMIALKSDGWEQDRRSFFDAGFDLPEPFTFSRLARQPDGREVKVGFDLTFVPDAALPDAVFFTCDHQHEPEFFYKPEFQKHDNGALAVDEVIMVCHDPDKLRMFFQRLYGSESITERAGVLSVQGGGFCFSVLSVAQLQARFQMEAPVDITGDGVFAGSRIRVSDLQNMRALLRDNEVKHADQGDCLRLFAFGACIEFSSNACCEDIK